MAEAYTLDSEAAEADRRFSIQSEDDIEAIELARTHRWEGHGRDHSDDELREERLLVV